MPFNIQWADCGEGPEQNVRISTPVAALSLSFKGDVITSADWLSEVGSGQSFAFDGHHPIQQELDRFWLDAERIIPIKLLKQGSLYRNRVWTALCQIPFGTTISYSTLAGKIGSSARAVGNACRDNPYPLFIPCHRVVSLTGLGGYGGQTKGDLMAIKIKLLQLEANRKA